jgi:hypothetical protein
VQCFPPNYLSGWQVKVQTTDKSYRFSALFHPLLVKLMEASSRSFKARIRGDIEQDDAKAEAMYS